MSEQTMTKAEREAQQLAETREAQRKAREQAFLAKANYHETAPAVAQAPAPAPAPVAAPAPAPVDTPVDTAPEAQESPAEPSEDMADEPQAVQTPENPPAARKTAPARRKKEPPKWETVDPRGKAYFSTQFSAPDDEKMNWLCENVPRMTKQKIVKAALAEYLERMLAEHYKP